MVALFKYCYLASTSYYLLCYSFTLNNHICNAVAWSVFHSHGKGSLCLQYIDLSRVSSVHRLPENMKKCAFAVTMLDCTIRQLCVDSGKTQFILSQRILMSPVVFWWTLSLPYLRPLLEPACVCKSLHVRSSHVPLWSPSSRESLQFGSYSLILKIVLKVKTWWLN